MTSKPHTGPLNNLDPKPGMCIQAYLPQPPNGIASGVQAYVVIGVNPHWITLLWPPKLRVVKLRHKDWANTPAAIFPCILAESIRRLEENINLRRDNRMRSNFTAANKALALLRARLEKETRP